MAVQLDLSDRFTPGKSPVASNWALCFVFQLGANGYSFLINNNGHVIYHPDLRAPVNTNSPFLARGIAIAGCGCGYDCGYAANGRGVASIDHPTGRIGIGIGIEAKRFDIECRIS